MDISNEKIYKKSQKSLDAKTSKRTIKKNSKKSLKKEKEESAKIVSESKSSGKKSNKQLLNDQITVKTLKNILKNSSSKASKDNKETNEFKLWNDKEQKQSEQNKQSNSDHYSDDNDSRLYRKKVLTRFYTKQLLILLWKSLIVRTKHYISTFFEIFFPILFIALICWIYSLSNTSNEAEKLKNSNNNYYSYTNSVNKTKGPIYYYKQQEMNLSSDEAINQFLDNLYYSPVNNITRDMMSVFEQYNGEYFNLIPVEDNNHDNVFERFDFHSYDFGIHYRNASCNTDLLTKKISYQITAGIGQGSLLQKYYLKFNVQPIAFIDRDFYKTVATLQYNINNNYIRLLCKYKNITDCKDYLLPRINVYRMPYPEYKFIHNDFSQVFNAIGILIIYAYLVYVPLLVKRILDEKSSKARELLHMIGMTDGVYWLSHFINNFIVIVFHSIVITIMFFSLFKFTILIYSSKLLILFAFILFGIQVILFSMLLTTLFPGPIFGTITTTLLWLILNSLIWGSLHPILGDFYPEQTANLYRRLMSLSPLGSIMFFFFQVGDFEQRQIGLGFSNLNQGTEILGSFTALETLLIMIISIPLYCVLIFYLDNVWPLQERPKSPIFCLTLAYWFKDKNTSYSFDEHDDYNCPSDSKMFQTFQYNKPPVIVVDNLVKQFSSKTVLKEVNLRIYSNEITVLLGHNGAGKSTLMNIITGMLSPTCGDVYVNGFNVQTQTIYARKSLSLCPQENIFFPELTVGQHLRLFALLKGITYDDVDREVDELLALLKIDHKKYDYAYDLSGGMKRKLSLGIALIGETDTIILDEPTSGMDPDTRRSIWDVLLKLRRRKTILLTTHFMEEADILGDRIVILNDGQLKCDGSPHFLKKSLGTGYRLKIGKLPQFDADKFLAFLRTILPNSNMLSNIETEVIYALETTITDKKIFIQSLIKLFENMEMHRSDMKIDSFGLSYSTLEDIFLFVGSDIDKQTFNRSIMDNKLNSNIRETTSKDRKNVTNPAGGNKALTKFDELYTDCGLIGLQLHGLLVKRFNYSRRNLFLIIFQIIVPFSIILLAIYIKNIITESIHHGKLNDNELSLNTVELYSNNTKTFIYDNLWNSNDNGSDYNNTEKRTATIFVENMRKILQQKQSSKIMFSTKFDADNGTTNMETLLRNVSDSILASVNNDLDEYHKNYLYGFGVIDGQYHVWINYEQTQSLFLALKTIFEATLCTMMNDRPCDDVTIKHSLFSSNTPKNHSDNGDVAVRIIQWALNAIIFIPIAFLFLMSSFTLFIIEENSNKSKLIQFMSRLSPVIYWFGNFVYDIIVHLSAIFLIVIMICYLDNSDILFSDTTQRYGFSFFILSFLLGIGMIPIIYLLTFRCDRQSSGFVFILIFCLILGFFPNLMLSVLQLPKTFTDYNQFDYIYQKVVIPLRFFPIFSFMFGYQKIYLLSTLNDYCSNIDSNVLSKVCDSPNENFMKGCCPKPKCKVCFKELSPFSLSDYGAGKEMLHMFFVGAFAFLVILYYETVFKKRLSNLYEYCFLSKDIPKDYENIEDDDVRNERKRIDREINKQHESENILSVSHLHKKYSNLTAVYDVTFGVYPQECFGLLGVNGAGKTTTFAMLTGDIVPTSGEAYLNDLNLSLNEQTIAFQTKIGYCPQYDALVGRLTGEETLYFYARIKGIPFENMDRDVNNLIEMVGLVKHAKNLVDSYSGGNKRKLSLAIALIGNPMILLLDEPSCGVDPAARRKIWQTLGYIKKNFNCSIILTSHSMDECEALCSRVAIMVNGRFCCIGSTRHLRSKYGQGYSVIITLESDQADDKSYFDEVNRNVLKTFPSAFLKDYHQCSLSYHITDSNEKWSNIFRQMSILDEKFHFNDYHVSDTTLEQIFLMFARGQNNYFAKNSV